MTIIWTDTLPRFARIAEKARGHWLDPAIFLCHIRRLMENNHMTKSCYKSAMAAICLLIVWAAVSSAGFATSVCCPDIADLCRISHQATVNASHGTEPCMPSHHPSRGQVHHNPAVIAAEGHQDGVTCCEASPCMQAGLTLIVPPPQPEPPPFTAVGTTVELAIVNRNHSNTTALTTPLPSSTPLYLQKSVLIC